MAQNVIFQVCDLERSRSSMKVKKFSIRPPPPAHKYTCEVPLKYCQFWIVSIVSYGLSIIDRKVARRKKELRQNMTETL